MAGKHTRTHQNLIDCGMRLFFADGFDQVKITDICREAKISRPTFYLHFKGKEHLISEYYESSWFFSEDMEQWVRSAPDPWSAIIRLQMIYIQYTYNTDHLDLVSRYLSYKLMSGGANIFSEFRSKLEDMLTALLREAQSAHIVRNVSDPYYLCKTIFMLHAGNLFQWCAAGGRSDCGRDFFWNLEAMLWVEGDYCGIWKLAENYVISNSSARA